METEVSSRDIAVRLLGANPGRRFAFADGAVAVRIDSPARWWPVASKSILGGWVDLGHEGLPLVNGEPVYPEDAWTEIDR